MVSVLIFAFCLGVTAQAEQALFYRMSNSTKKAPRSIDINQNQSKTVEDVLSWLQTRYKEVNRRARDDLSRGYLPSDFGSSTQEPRPFQTRGPKPKPTERVTQGYQPTGYNYRKPSTTQTYQTGYDYNSPTTPQSYQPSTQDYQQNSVSQEYDQPASTAITNQQPIQQPQPIDNGNHPPHIHDLKVLCSKEKLEIDLEFNEVFNGVIYSKGYHNIPECRYVQPGSNSNKYKFTLMLNTCGTQFVDEFSAGKDAYLENTLVIQNEPGILEVWDAIRNVRCLWEGSISQSLSSGLSIGSLNQEIVTFSGDTGQAKLEIQAGRGPYSYGATELVQIGDLMTLVVSVDGDNSFELRIGECRGTDGRENTILLTDDRGCTLKDKLLGGFQYTRHEQTGAALAYAYFRAFKFPDVMDLTLECSVQLCKTECKQTCDDPNQKYEPSRKRRSINSTEDTTLSRTIRVFLPTDIRLAPLNDERLCMTKPAFYLGTATLGFLAIVSSLITLRFWFGSRRKLT